jgi:hypothetical protein
VKQYQHYFTWSCCKCHRKTKPTDAVGWIDGWLNIATYLLISAGNIV